jgi:hypothetical protein
LESEEFGRICETKEEAIDCVNLNHSLKMKYFILLLFAIGLIQQVDSANIRSRREVIENAPIGGATGGEELSSSTGSETGSATGGSSGSDGLTTTMIKQTFVVWGLSEEAAKVDKKIVIKGIAASIGVDLTNIEIIGLELVPSVKDHSVEIPKNDLVKDDVTADLGGTITPVKEAGEMDDNEEHANAEEQQEHANAEEQHANDKSTEEPTDETEKVGVVGKLVNSIKTRRGRTLLSTSLDVGEDEEVVKEDGPEVVEMERKKAEEEKDLAIAYEVAIEDSSTKDKILQKMINKEEFTKSLNLAFKDGDGGISNVKSIQVMTMETPVVETKTITNANGPAKVDQVISVIREQIKVVTKNAIQDLNENTKQIVEDVQMKQQREKDQGDAQLGVMKIQNVNNMFDHEASLSLKMARKGIEGEDPEMEKIRDEMDEEKEGSNIPAATPAAATGSAMGAAATGSATGGTR